MFNESSMYSYVLVLTQEEPNAEQSHSYVIQRVVKLKRFRKCRLCKTNKAPWGATSGAVKVYICLKKAVVFFSTSTTLFNRDIYEL